MQKTISIIILAFLLIVLIELIIFNLQISTAAGVASTHCYKYYWYNNDINQCESSTACGVLSLYNLKTYLTKEDCEKNNLNKTITESSCSYYYWHDNNQLSCDYKQFCGVYMYYGLKTFKTLEECNQDLNKTTESCVCITLYKPVCGVDGKTYSNSCLAKCAKVEYTEGECKNETICKKEGETGHLNQKPNCCNGLTAITNSDKGESCDQETGICRVETGGDYICTKCNDNICGTGENNYNCPKDCSDKICEQDKDCPTINCIKAPCPKYKCINGKCILENNPDKCKDNEIKKYKCPDGTEVSWCVCTNGLWTCVLSPKNKCKKEKHIVGNDQDEHGCIGSAGYQWCKEKQKCLRIWEEECSDISYNCPEIIPVNCENGTTIERPTDEKGCKRSPICIKILTSSNSETSKDSKIKIMPETASERAKERLGDLGFTISLKEVGAEKKQVYQLDAEKSVKIFGFMKIKAKVSAQVDAETGNVISVKKPWWSFMASGF